MFSVLQQRTEDVLKMSKGISKYVKCQIYCVSGTHTVYRKRDANLFKISQMCVSIKWNDMKLPLLSQFLPIVWKTQISQSVSVQSTKGEEDERTGWEKGTHAKESQGYYMQ